MEEEGLMEVEEDIKGVNGNEKNTIKINLKKEQKVTYLVSLSPSMKESTLTGLI